MAKAPFAITDLRGGINDSDTPVLLPDNVFVDGRNVDFRFGALGAKRNGTTGLTPSGVWDSRVVALFRHTPGNSVSNDELWGLDENGHLDRRVGGTWQGGVTKVNDYVTIDADNYDANASSLHGKLFIAAKGPKDRLIVWDGTVLRWAGFWQTPDPTVANSGSAGSYTGTRYFRIRYTEQVSGVTVRRSEPSNAVSLAPDGSHNGAVITKPSGTEATTSQYCEGQTHWEVEASIDNILFYVIATVAIGTSTYTDTTDYSVGYSASDLSPTSGDYIAPGSAKHVATDDDRVLMAGSNFTDAYDARVQWTPVNGADGVGNDERIPQTTLQYITFDGLDGGGVTALVTGVAGATYVFKRTRIYKMVRTGVVSSAYDPVAESQSRGSTMRGAAAGLDANGAPCVYFLDQAIGLCRIGQNGVEDLARAVRKTWKTWNKNASIQPRILHYPELDQVWYAVPLGAADEPSRMFVYETRYSAPLYHDGLLAQVLCMTLFADSSLVLRPFVGTALITTLGGLDTYVHRCDDPTVSADGGTAFQAYVKTKPYLPGNLWQQFGILAGALIAGAETGATLSCYLSRDFALEASTTRDVALDASGAETYVVKAIDDLQMAELTAVQLWFGDASALDQTWSVDRFVFLIRSEGDQVS